MLKLKFDGINSPYEVPDNPEFILSTAKTTPEQLADQLLSQLDI
ncbi:hypothetical protein N9449_00495 [Oceanospirillaceae bacterium]|nr:hypothetical protein [Oceanospirillaceae bacterium]